MERSRLGANESAERSRFGANDTRYNGTDSQNRSPGKAETNGASRMMPNNRATDSESELKNAENIDANRPPVHTNGVALKQHSGNASHTKSFFSVSDASIRSEGNLTVISHLSSNVSNQSYNNNNKVSESESVHQRHHDSDTNTHTNNHNNHHNNNNDNGHRNGTLTEAEVARARLGVRNGEQQSALQHQHVHTKVDYSQRRNNNNNTTNNWSNDSSNVSQRETNVSSWKTDSDSTRKDNKSSSVDWSNNSDHSKSDLSLQLVSTVDIPPPPRYVCMYVCA